MTAQVGVRPGGYPATRHLDGVSFALTPSWGGNTFQLHATRGAATVFTAVAIRMPTGQWLLDDCLPQRGGTTVATLLCQAGRWLAERATAADVIAIHPAHWDEHLAAIGARPLHRVVALSSVLDADHLRLHERALPDGYHVAALSGPAGDASRLSLLSPAGDRDNDRAVWSDVLGGVYGPLIPEACATIGNGSGTVAAIAVTQYRGQPFVGHLVIADDVRGQGLGRALLVHSLQRLLRAGYSECRLNVVEDNWIAHRLYRSVGFTRCHATLRVSLLSREDATDVR